MNNILNYCIVVKQQENGKFLITYPDFEGISSVAETEKSIQDIAKSTLKLKYEELKKNNFEIKEPLKISELSKNLKSGEFIMNIPFQPSFDFKKLADSLKDTQVVKEKVKNVIDGDIKEKFNNTPVRTLGITAGVISILNTLLFSLVVIKVPFFGNYSVNFFKGLGELAQISSDIKKLNILLLLSGFIFLTIGGLIIFSSLQSKKNIFKYSTFSHIAFFILFYIVLFIKIPNDASKFISISVLKIFIYIISSGLAFYTYKRMVEYEK